MLKSRFFIKTFGCSHNISDSERMISSLIAKGYDLVISMEDADFFIINTCTVKIPTEQKILSYLRKISKNGKPIIVAGCIPQSNKEMVNNELKNFSIIGTNSIRKISEVARRSLEGERVVALDTEKEGYQSADYLFNSFIKIIPISSGCLGACTYCKTKFARGYLKSRDVKEIVSEINLFLKKGIYDFWLSSEDCGAFGLDRKTNILELLKAIEEIPCEFKVRLGMANPEHLYPIRHELADFFSKTKRFYKFLHIPVQSGNNEVLKAMNRKYSVEEFSELLRTLRKNSDLSLSTDIICGFPGETKEQFQDSVNLIEEIQFDVLNISKFWPLKKTLAAKLLNQISDIEKGRRSKLIGILFKKFALIRNKFWKNWTGCVFVSEQKCAHTFVGRNYAYKPIVVYSDENLLGKVVDVKITEVNGLFLKGVLS